MSVILQKNNFINLHKFLNLQLNYLVSLVFISLNEQVSLELSKQHLMSQLHQVFDTFD